MKHKAAIAVTWVALTCVTNSAARAQQVLPSGFYSFGTDQTIADIGKIEWAPLQLQGLPPGIEIAVLRGDLTKGGGEISCEHLPSTSSQITATQATRYMSG